MIVVFSIIDGVLLLATPIAVEALVNTVAFGRYLQPIVVLAIMLFTFLTFAAALRGLLSYVVEILQRRLFVRLVADLAYRLPRVRGTAFDDVHGPGIGQSFLRDRDRPEGRQFAAAGRGLDHPADLRGHGGAGLLPSVPAGLRPRAAAADRVHHLRPRPRGGEDGSERVDREVCGGRLVGGVGSSSHGVQAALRPSFALDRSDRLTVDYLDARRMHYRIVLRQLLFALGLQAVVATALLGLGGWLVIQGQLTLGQLVAAELIVTVIVGSFAKMGKHLESFYDLLASMDKLGHLFDLPTERHDKQFHLQAGVPAQVAVRRCPTATAPRRATDTKCCTTSAWKSSRANTSP